MPKTIPRLRLVTFAAYAALGALLGCGTGLGSSPAEKDADGAAERAGSVMVNLPQLTPGQRIGLVTGTNATRTIDALEADGTPDGVVILRISSSVDQGSFNGTDQAIRCYKYQLEGGYLSPDPHRIDCPDRPVVTPSVIPPDGQLPQDAQARATSAVKALSPTRQLDAQAVTAALRRAFSADSVRLDTATAGSRLGFSVAAGKASCLFGQLTPGVAGAKPKLETWIVPRVLAQAGELGCAAEFAAAGDGKNPPH
jgi:hypothetical protein